MTPTIRDATAKDIEAIVKVARAGAVDSHQYAPLDLSDPAYLAAFRAIESDPNHRLIVLEQADEVIGCMQISFLPDLMRAGTWRGQLENIHVREDYRGKGYGGLLTEWAIARCREKGCTLVQLTSNKQRVDAHRFYERLGFKRSHEGFKLTLEESG